MDDLGRRFRSYVLATTLEGCAVAQVDADHITLTCDHALGQVNFYDLGDEFAEIVELCIIDPDCPDEPRFFLHFELEDENRAKELFAEMCEQLVITDQSGTTHVLLCCTAGLTTTMFANRLQEAAKTLSLDYKFDAIPLEQAETEGGHYDAVLLAPQVGYQRREVMKVFPDAVVVQIPSKIFATYDVAACLKLVLHLLSDNTVFPTADANDLRLVRDIQNDKRIMVVSVIKRPKNTWVGWRIYDCGEVRDFGSITKYNYDVRDIEDLLRTLHLRGWNVGELDAVGIAVPGVVNRGTVIDTYIAISNELAGKKYSTHYELGRALSERFGTKIFVDNNANAAAVGCYMSQEQYDSVVLHTQQTGYLIGGQGVVVDGHLLKGRRNFAGELGPLFHALYAPKRPGRVAYDYANNTLDDERAWSPEGLLGVVAPVLAADVSLVAPDAIYVAVDLLDDMDALREEMKKYFAEFQEDYLPDLIRVVDYRERIALGELALCLQKLHNPRPHRKH